MDKRNYGIDVLKILSMFMIVVLHVVETGGILKTVPSGGFILSPIPDIMKPRKDGGKQFAEVNDIAERESLCL